MCWHVDQDSYREGLHVCNVVSCPPMDDVYPMDEYTLGKAFWKSGTHSKKGLVWLQQHLDTFITESTIRELKETGITHVRVPIPHWIVPEGRVLLDTDNNKDDDDPMHFRRDEYFMGGADVWKKFVQFLQ